MALIKFTSKTNRPTMKLNGKRYIGFKISKVPTKFASLSHKEPIKNWFNYQGYTFFRAEALG